MRFSCARFRVKHLPLWVAAIVFFLIICHFFFHPYHKENERQSIMNPHAFSSLAAQRSSTGNSKDAEVLSTKNEGGELSTGRDPLIWANGMKNESGGLSAARDPLIWANGTKNEGGGLSSGRDALIWANGTKNEGGGLSSGRDPLIWANGTKNEGGGLSSGRDSVIWANGTGLVDRVRAMFRQNGVVLFTFINDAYLEMAASWCCNTRSFPQLHRRVVFLTTDLPTAQRLRAFCPGDVTVAVESSPYYSGALNYSGAGYVRLMVERAHLVLRLLESGVQLLQFEVDFVWFKDPMPVLLSRQAGADIVVTQNNNRTRACGGFLFLNPTPATLSFWRRFVEVMDDLHRKIEKYKKAEAVPEGLNTQGFLQRLIAQNYAGVRIHYLPYEDFPDGKWYTWPLARQQELQPYFIHNNWIVGEPAKRLRAKEYGHWFWDSSTNRCDSSALRHWNL